MDALNFLRIEPLANWFDYFLNRPSFIALLTNANALTSDTPSTSVQLAQLMDQFIEQALVAERDSILLEKKGPLADTEDVHNLRVKMEELWLCAGCCAAAVGWDLEAMAKHSNAIRLRALLHRLLQWSYGTGSTPFSLPDTSFQPATLFTAWLYAKWVLLVERQARFPSPPAKPTVSNPQALLDQNLLLAERINQTVAEVRQGTKDAVELMTKLMKRLDEEGLATSAIDVPGWDCFMPPSLELRRSFPIQPNFTARLHKIPSQLFKLVTQYDLMLTHTAAMHFTAARELLTQVRSASRNITNMAGLAVFNVNLDQLEAYSKAYELDGVSWRNLGGKDKARKVDLMAELRGGGAVSSQLVRRLAENDAERGEFVKKLTAELEACRASSPVEFGRLWAVAAFLSSRLPNFSLDLVKPKTEIEAIVVDSAPSGNYLQELTSCGPHLWNALTSYDVKVLTNAFTALGATYRVPPRHFYSQLVGDELLARCDDLSHHQVATLLWKLEHLARAGDIDGWRKFVDAMVNKLGGLVDQKITFLLAFDALRVEIEQWNRDLHRSDSSEFQPDAAALMGHFTSILHLIKEQKSTAFLKASIQLSAFMLNTRRWNELFNDIGKHSSFKTGITDVASGLAAYLHYAVEQRGVDNARAIADVCWQVLVPTFETGSKRSSKPTATLIGQEDFLALVGLLKQSDVLSFLLSLVVYLHNATLPMPMEARRVYFPAEESTWDKPGYDGSNLNMPYLHSVVEALLENAMRVDPLNRAWLRIHGDYRFARGNSRAAMSRYLELMVASDKAVPETDLAAQLQMDTVCSKMALCLAELRMPTLAAMVGQLRHDIRPHLEHVFIFLTATPTTWDAASAYFPLVANMDLMEVMVNAYAKLDLPIYQKRLLRDCPTRAMNESNPPEALRMEKERRIRRLKEILYRQFL